MVPWLTFTYYGHAFQNDKDFVRDGESSSVSVAQAAEALFDNDVDDDDDDLDVDELNELEASLSGASLQNNEPSDSV